MKKILVYLMFLGILLFSSLNLNAAFVTKTYKMNDDCWVDKGKQLVYVTCEFDACVLNCYGGGNRKCCWSCAEDFIGCGDSYDAFMNAMGEDMFDYMHEQLELNIFIGTYNSNIVFWPTNTIYYRSIIWNYNPISEQLEATLYISYEK